MVIAEYNERKRQILEYVRDNEPVSSWDVSRDLDLEVHNARTLLAKYARFGLLRRENHWGKRGHPFEYTITERGEERLIWLQGIFETPTPRLEWAKGETSLPPARHDKGKASLS